MVKRYSRAVVRRRPRRVNGGSFRSFLSGANKWLRKTKALSKAGRFLSDAGVPYAGNMGKVASVLGYGRGRTVRRRRRTKGGALSLGGSRGGALRLAGAGSRGFKKRYPVGIAY